MTQDERRISARLQEARRLRQRDAVMQYFFGAGERLTSRSSELERIRSHFPDEVPSLGALRLPEDTLLTVRTAGHSLPYQLMSNGMVDEMIRARKQIEERTAPLQHYTYAISRGYLEDLLASAFITTFSARMLIEPTVDNRIGQFLMFNLRGHLDNISDFSQLTDTQRSQSSLMLFSALTQIHQALGTIPAVVAAEEQGIL